MLTLALGIADITIGTPAVISTNALGTLTKASADFVRVTIPGTTAVPVNNPVGGPLGSVLNPVLNPVVSALSPALKSLQSALTAAHLDVADLRVGHLEATAQVPAGGIDCSAVTPPNPISESRKDVSAFTVAPGATFTYTIRVPNRGTQDLLDTEVVDTFSGSPSLEFVSSTPAPASQSGNTLTYELGTLTPNQFDTIVMTFRVPASAPNGTVYHNAAVITGVYAGLPVTFPVSVDGPIVGTSGNGTCTIFATKYASNTQVTTGEDFGYFINVYNGSGQACDNVTVTDPLISGVSFVSCTAGCSHSGQDVTWVLGTLAPGASTVVSVVVRVTATSGTLPDTGHVTASNGPPANPMTPGPTITAVSVPAPGAPAGGMASKLAYTGLAAWVPLAALLLLIGAGLGIRMRRRTEDN